MTKRSKGAKTRNVKPEGTLEDLNVNPCKMCMPLGSVTAAYGVEGCMSILHGSQGCATYIRRHMATHYNEPIDVASSALTEQGTVYGGEANLHKGIDNLIKLYNPHVINISTTCLAETIGEDVPSMIFRWYESHPKSNTLLVSTPSPGYGGSQYEGYFSFLRSLVTTVPMDPSLAAAHQLNVICGPISPADTRFLKQMIKSFGIHAVMLPDVSSSLDQGRLSVYNRTPEGGTKLTAIRSMAGSDLTIELGEFVPKAMSPGQYLQDRYGVRCQRMNAPIALRDIDAFIKILEEFSGRKISASVAQERARYLDAMIDSHKYNSEGRACIFGDPDFCYGITRLCLENGIVPVVVAAGSACPEFKKHIQPQIDDLAQRFLVDNFDVVQAADFGDIERLAKKNGANVLIGSSDGRRVEATCAIPLIRCTFPIHDQIGGQRVRTMGYSGSLMLLDRITNALLLRKTSGFRAAIRNEFYDNTLLSQAHLHRQTQSEQLVAEAQACLDDAASDYTATREQQKHSEAVQKTKSHPCFTAGCSSKNARIHLPVAPKCNISCNYCVRRFDCPNESRPGVTSQVLTPKQAFEYWKDARKRIPNLTTVGIAGPGDALANWDKTIETINLIHKTDPQSVFCLSTNGLLLPRYADKIAAAGVTHVTVTMNAIDPIIGAQIYEHVNLDGNTYIGQAAAGILLSNQIAGICMLVQAGVIVKVNTVLIEGVNDSHVEEVTKKAAELGASVSNIMQMIPVKGSVFGGKAQVPQKKLACIRKTCRAYLPQMGHCQQCRADAVGTLYEDLSHLFLDKKAPHTQTSHHQAYRMAVASKSGLMVDEHFGHAQQLAIFESNGTSVRFVENRNLDTYCKGSDACLKEQSKDVRMQRVVSLLADCDALLCLRAGTEPMRMLADAGIEVRLTCDRIETAVLDAEQSLVSKGIIPVLSRMQSI